MEHDPVLLHALGVDCGLSLNIANPPLFPLRKDVSNSQVGSSPNDLQALLRDGPIGPIGQVSQPPTTASEPLVPTPPPPFNSFNVPSTPIEPQNDASMDDFDFDDSLQTSTSPGHSTTSASRSSTPSPSPTSRRCNRISRTVISGVRQRATQLCPTFGLMSAKKGSAPYDVVRTGSLVGRVEKSEVNRRFTRSLDRILLQCERLADETDGWVFVAAQHPSVQGEHVHWTLPAMAAELPPDATTRLDGTMSALFKALKTARRQNVAEVELEATKAWAERDLAQSHLAEKDAIITRLAEQLRSQGMNIEDLLQLESQDA
ncbi:hypothetical protein AAF712_006034 [Marasmius tenuissimus]|uniref:Uncharacterized protein n=1 Tax=Marasmius tenuissimus TaxID=585030 RepID=A0ABR3A0L2_9AGAR